MRILLFLLTSAVLSASDHPAERVQLGLPDKVTLAPGRSAELNIHVTVPAEHHIYLKHASKTGHAILTQFSVPGETGFQLRELKRPKGTKVENEFVLRGNGAFQFELSELGMHADGKSLQVPLNIRIQICGEGEAAICYMPVTIERKLHVEVAGLEIQTRDLPDATLPWVNSHATALEAAKLKQVNIFALISNPSRCGACVQLESKVLPDPAVNKMLKTNFVTWRVQRNEYSKAQIKGGFGIPFYFIVSPDGQILQKWMGGAGSTGVYPAPRALCQNPGNRGHGQRSACKRRHTPGCVQNSPEAEFRLPGHATGGFQKFGEYAVRLE